MRGTLAVVLLASASLLAAEPPAPHPKGYVCGRAPRPIRVDGRLDDEAWALAPWTDDFVDIEGSARPRPRFRTRVKMLWDDRYFYVAAELEEPDVWGTLTKHDAVIFHDNDFEVFLDPDGDNHQYYEFEINALNTGWDLRLPKPYRDGGSAIDAWEIPGLVTAVDVQGTRNDPSDRDRGWTVELAFPWPALGEFAGGSPAPPREGDQWRVNFSRVEWLHEVLDGRYRKVAGRKEDNWVWSPQGAVDMHRPELWGYVQFTERPPGQVAFRPDPAWPARDLLRRIYLAIRAARGVDPVAAARGVEPPATPGLGRPTVRITAEGYEAAVTIAPTPGAPETWHIRQDSRLWRDP